MATDLTKKWFLAAPLIRAAVRKSVECDAMPAKFRLSRQARAVTTIVAVLSITISFLLARAFVKEWFAVPAYDASCNDERYQDCIDLAKTFLDRDYTETKDLSKAFLTLLTAFLVGSITFSEKIVDVNRSTWVPKALMISCWCCILLAIVACGSGLALMASAAGFASYTPGYDYRHLEQRAIQLYVLSGIAFGGSLVMLLCAGTISLFTRET